MAKRIEGAGGLVFNPQGEVLLIRDRSGYWCFPKGHIDPGETPSQTALREIEEETGIVATLEGSLSNTSYTNNKGVERLIYWFKMQGEGTIVLEEGMHGAGFFDTQEAKRLLAFAEDVALLEEAL